MWDEHGLHRGPWEPPPAPGSAFGPQAPIYRSGNMPGPGARDIKRGGRPRRWAGGGGDPDPDQSNPEQGRMPINRPMNKWDLETPEGPPGADRYSQHMKALRNDVIQEMIDRRNQPDMPEPNVHKAGGRARRADGGQGSPSAPPPGGGPSGPSVQDLINYQRMINRRDGGRTRRADGGGAKPMADYLPKTPEQWDALDRVIREWRAQDRSTGKGAGDYPANWDEETGFGAPGSKKSGGRLSMGERTKLPSTDFALPGAGSGPSGKGSGSYPIPDESHARNALSRAAQHASPAEQATIKRKVHAKYPDIDIGGE